jgi:small GTP-binding protein
MKSTIGTDSQNIKVQFGRKDIILNIWDTAGQEQFSSLVPMYIRDAIICIIVAAIDDQNSIDHITSWKEKLDQTNEKSEVFVVVNKIDAKNYAVSEDTIFKTYEKISHHLLFVSAATGEGIEDLFQTITRVSFELLQSYQFPPPSMQVENQSKSKPCC